MYFMSMHQIHVNGEMVSNEMQYVPIAGTPTDDILLRLAFDHSSGKFTASYSYDGGSAYLGSLSFDISLSLPEYPGSWAIFDDWDLGAESFTLSTVSVPEPATIVLLGFGLAGLTAFRKKKLFKG